MANRRQYALFALAASLPLSFEVVPGVLSAPVLGLTALLVPYMIAKYHLDHRQLLRTIIFCTSAALGIISILTGYVNYLTDEFATPQYVTLLLQGRDWYSFPLQFQYVRSGMVLSAQVWNVYLPLLALVQIPYIWLDYRWFTLGVWGLLVYSLRNRYYASMALAGQYSAVMAANGFNDVIPLLFLTLAFVTFKGRRAKATEYISLGMKQFANIFVFLYYLLRRDWRQAAVTVIVTALFLLPFAIWDWKSAICTPILDMPPDCHNMNNLTFNSVHSLINFAIWPIWVIAVFYPTLGVEAVRVRVRLSKLLRGHLNRTRFAQASRSGGIDHA